MNKRAFWIIAGLAALLLTLVAWLFSSSDAPQSAQDEQTTRQPDHAALEEPMPRDEDGAAGEEDAEIEPISDAQEEPTAAIEIPPELSTVDGVLNEWARLVGEEYDLWIQTHSESEASLEAFTIVSDRIMSDPEYAVLKEAIKRTINDFPPNAQHPSVMLWRAGRIPIWKVPCFVELPNGEIYNMPHNTKLIVRFKTRSLLSADGKQALKENTQRQNELLADLAKGAASEDEENAMLKELKSVEERLNHIHSPSYSNKQRTYLWGDPDEGPFNEVVMDLGIVERDLETATNEARTVLEGLLAQPDWSPETIKELQRELDALDQ